MHSHLLPVHVKHEFQRMTADILCIQVLFDLVLCECNGTASDGSYCKRYVTETQQIMKNETICGDHSRQN